jgi:hypothetical protein
MSGNADINNAINQYIESKQLDKIISQSIQNIMLDDPTFSEYMRNNGKKNVKIGDFVYFKHKIDTDAPDICADNESQREIIVGGKVCGINPINNSVKVSYSYVMNPNYNKRCASIGAANYDRGVAGLPKWYAGAGSDVSKVCGPGPEKNMACKPSQWSRDGNTDNWVRKYIGGFDISKDEMSCGIGPSYYNLPQTVPIMALSKSLDDVVSSCAANLTADKPELEPLPRPKYNPQASQFLPVPKRVPTPPKPKKEFKVGGQSWTSDVDGVGFQSRGDVDLSKLSELGKKTAEQLAKDQSQIGRTGPTEGPDVIKQRGPRQEIQRVQIERPVQQKEKVRNDTLLENRCVNAEKDNNNPNRYIQNKTGKKFFIKNGMVFQEDKQLKLPNNVPVKYIYKKQSKDTILAYGSDNNWYQFKLFENPDGSTKQEFRKVDQTSLTEDYDGEIDPSGQCIPGNKV